MAGLLRQFVFPANRWFRGPSCEAHLASNEPLADSGAPAAAATSRQTFSPTGSGSRTPTGQLPQRGSCASLVGVAASSSAPLPLLTAPHTASHVLLRDADPRRPPSYRVLVLATNGSAGGGSWDGATGPLVGTGDDVLTAVIYGDAGNTGEVRLVAGEPVALESGDGLGGMVRLRGATGVERWGAHDRPSQTIPSWDRPPSLVPPSRP